ncbi:aminopeptidase M1 [Tanacetum coccineum]
MTLIYSPGCSSNPIYLLGSSTPPRYSTRASTPQSYSPGTSRNAKCSNCKHLLGKITSAWQSTLKVEEQGRVVAAHVLWTECRIIYARRCFPCWDEPACKATFKITLEVPSQLITLSNMPVVEEKLNGILKIVSYQESPIMSTYLVVAVDGLFDYAEDHTPDGTSTSFASSLPVCYHLTMSYPFAGIKVRVYCQAGKANQGMFALDVAVKTLDLYKEYALRNI